MPVNLENSAVATGLGKVSFYPNSKERQCQRMFKLPYCCTHFTCQLDYAQDPSTQALAVCEPKTFRCTKRFRKGRGTRDATANICWIIEKAREFQKIIYFCFMDYIKAFDCVDHNKLWKILKEMGIPKKPVCRTRSNSQCWTWKMDWFKIGKGVRQGYILSP